MKNTDEYIAHTRLTGQMDNENEIEIQTVAEHLQSTAEIASKFSIPELGNIVYHSGLLHDVGKYQSAFQERIRGKDIRVDHSTCGAIEAKKNYKNFTAQLLAYIIAGHHGGIPDGGSKADLPEEKSTLSARLKKDDLESWAAYKNDIQLTDLDDQQFMNFLFQDLDQGDQKHLNEMLIDKFAFFTRMAYSCLVDADSLDTEHYCEQIERETLKSDYDACLEHLNRRFDEFVCTTELQKTRSQIQSQAYKNIQNNAEVYLMNMPTGSGKTLCSAKCALMKAIEEKKKHIIYIIPYNSIISQTAEEFKKIFGEDAQILRHQSTYSIDDEENADDAYKVHVSQATENWDADFIITTAVQFFETTFSNKRRSLRKMHNMADSILIFDEAHLMPVEYFQPCLESISYLTRYCGSKAVFLTATMPDYERLLHHYTFPDLKVVDLIPDKTQFKVFKKNEYVDLGAVSKERLYHLSQESLSALIVVNSRKEARALYEAFGGKAKENLYHLSTYMTKIDIQKTIDTVKDKLSAIRNGSITMKEPLVVISTSLIEAGVDLDFHTAFREYAGLDSILQTGGRCNREGKDAEKGKVYVFEINDDGSGTFYQKTDKPRISVTKSLLKQYDDLSSGECVREYYRQVYFFGEQEMTKNAMYHFCPNVLSIPFASYDGGIIKSQDVSIIVPQDQEAEKIISKMRAVKLNKKEYRRLQKYTCSITNKDLEDLEPQGVIETDETGLMVLTNLDYYDHQTGIQLEGVDQFV